MVKYPKILAVCKKSTLELAKEHDNRHLLSLIENNDPSVANVRKADRELKETIQALKTAFSEKHMRYGLQEVVFKQRDEVRNADYYDLVISVGGDGTFLWVSKMLSPGKAILGINADPSSSVGFFTCGSKENITSILDKVCSKQPDITERNVQRLQVKVNGQVACTRILNDVLFAATHPAAMTKYVLTAPVKDDLIQEEQKSSGIWISTAAGSTGANLSAGGWMLPLEDKRMQWVVREPMKNVIWGTKYRLLHGLFSENQKLTVRNKTRKALLAVDGTTDSIPVTTGDLIEIEKAPGGLKILGK